jgi:Ca2+-binding EF-hand superfamily protein
MKKTVYCIAAASCLILAVAPALAEEGMAHHGGFAEKMFREMDANNDGVVTKKEFDAFHNKMFKEMDANGDGKITHEEMEAMHKKMAGKMQEHFKQRFDEADANHDGALSKEEAQKMPMVAQHFDEIDTNHDGKVTMDEIKAAHEKMHEGKMHGQGGMAGCGGSAEDKTHCDMPQGGAMHKDAPAK